MYYMYFGVYPFVKTSRRLGGCNGFILGDGHLQGLGTTTSSLDLSMNYP